jgi:hypothetical protein
MFDLVLRVPLDRALRDRRLGPAHAWSVRVALLGTETAQLTLFGRDDSGWHGFGTWMLPARFELQVRAAGDSSDSPAPE